MSYLSSNRALLDRFRAGDSKALEQIYVHYAPGLARTLRGGFDFQWQAQPGRFQGFGLPLELADAIQEVFARAFSESSRLKYDGINSFAGYLAGIAHNVVIDHVRKRKTAASALQTFPGTTRSQLGTAPDVLAEEAEAGRVLAAFVSALDAKQRPLYQARFLDLLTQEDAARSLGLTRIQVRRAELNLRKALLEHLKRSGYLQGARITGWGLASSGPALPGRQAGP